jgi:hypothetical protein
MNPESLFPAWARLGINFPAFKPSKEEPLVEDLIAQTSKIGRYEPRLLEGMVGWITKHGELMNTSLMHKYISLGDSSVLGLVFDLLESKESEKLKNLNRYCVQKDKAEMLFYIAESSPRMKAEAIEKEQAINKKWNLYYANFRIKTDAVFERKWVLRNNSNLARRALFKPIMRTEILNMLLNKGKSFPAEIARNLRYQYHRIVDDIEELIREGAIIETILKKKREVQLSPSFKEYLQLTPYGSGN